MMTIEPIAYFRSPFSSKFGVPRQAGLVEELEGRIVFEPKYRNADALRGLEEFDYLWMIWGFSKNVAAEKHPTVRPPRLGGNVQMGVWATRSPFRPNNLGLSSVRIERIELSSAEGPVIHVKGADLMDGTPIYDIKPYLEYVDAHNGVRCGFTDNNSWALLNVEMPESCRQLFSESEQRALIKTLSLDPRPHYHDDAERVYGMPFGGYDVRFRVSGKTVYIEKLVKI